MALGGYEQIARTPWRVAGLAVGRLVAVHRDREKGRTRPRRGQSYLRTPRSLCHGQP